MSAPTAEGGQDDDDILGFPGDLFEEKTDGNPGVLGEQDEECDDTQMDVSTGGSVQDSVKKRKKSAVVSPDGFVTDRIISLKYTITGPKREDNEWTKMSRAKLGQDTPPNWSWFGVLFMFVAYGMLSETKEFPTVWVCACTKGCRKVYQKKSADWSAIMDHLVKVHDITKDAKHPTNISSQQKKARDECKTHALDDDMSEARFPDNVHHTVLHQEDVAFQTCRVSGIS